MLGKEGREKTADSKEGSERGLRPFLADTAFGDQGRWEESRVGGGSGWHPGRRQHSQPYMDISTSQLTRPSAATTPLDLP